MSAIQFKKRFLRLISIIILISFIIFLVVENFKTSDKFHSRNSLTQNGFHMREKDSYKIEDIDANYDFERDEPLKLNNGSKIKVEPEVPAIDSEEQLFEMKDADVGTELIPEPETTLTQRLESLLGCYYRELQMERLQYGKYWVVRNLVVGTLSRSMGCAESITFATQGDYTFFGNIEKIAERWMGPISFAVFSPGSDLASTLNSIQYVRNCLPKSDLIRDYVSFHVYFPNLHMPKYLPKTEEQALEWPFDCTSESPYTNVNRSEMYKSLNNLTYPINVGRNVARKAVNTHFILSSDIELYPSPGLIRQFLNLIDRNRTVLSTETKRVFPIPVFELNKFARLPNNKNELMELLRNKTAKPFHARICYECHSVPNQREWIKLLDNDEMSVFNVSKRIGKFRFWEPFYLSDNQEPKFDERVTWEGQANKRIQNYAMCLLDYEYHVLHPGFLVHSPGIKHFNKTSSRNNYAREMMNFIKRKIEPEYRILYGQNRHCVT